MSERRGRRENRGEGRECVEWLNGTLGDAAMLASNTVKLSVSPRENPFTNAAKWESKKKKKKGREV